MTTPNDNPEDDYKVIDSPLNGEMRRDGIDIDVQIYRGEDDEGWILEVIDAAGTSIIWEDRFATDQAAMDELKREIAANGMKQFNPHMQKHFDQ
jgi:hypothetical protein